MNRRRRGRSRLAPSDHEIRLCRSNPAPGNRRRRRWLVCRRRHAANARPAIKARITAAGSHQCPCSPIDPRSPFRDAELVSSPRPASVRGAGAGVGGGVEVVSAGAVAAARASVASGVLGFVSQEPAADGRRRGRHRRLRRRRRRRRRLRAQLALQFAQFVVLEFEQPMRVGELTLPDP